MQKTILIADDEQDIRETVKEILEKEGYKTVTAKDGDDCLKKLKANKVDLLLLDIMMPGAHTREIIKKANTKILFLSVVRTSEAEKGDLTKTKKITGFIEKPFNIKDLIKGVKKALGTS